MAWHSLFRRSIGTRRFRLNFTKRGVGASIGVPGLRRSWHSTGRRTTTVSIPGSGISWRKIEAGLGPRTNEIPDPPGGTVADALSLLDEIDG